MKNKKLLKILNTESPFDNTNTIAFVTLSRSKIFFKDFFAYSKEEKFFEFFEYTALKTRHQFNFFLKKLLKIEKNNYKNLTYQKFWLIIDIKQNKLIGSAKITNLDCIRKSVEWGYGINPKFWGNNYILNIQLSLLNYVFKKLNLNRLYTLTHVKNYRVIKAIEKLGFRKEGIRYDYYFHQTKKKFFNACGYSFLKSDFKKKNKTSKTSKKLSDANFYIVNKIISKTLNKKISIKKNISMNDIPEWDSISHFDLISRIEKKLGKKFSNQEILMSTSTENIVKVLRKR
jgi:RimJ/RimL family protein N-acetyltransferase/acyl carrier protein